MSPAITRVTLRGFVVVAVAHVVFDLADQFQAAVLPV
jgi:hypothetical protein